MGCDTSGLAAATASPHKAFQDPTRMYRAHLSRPKDADRFTVDGQMLISLLKCQQKIEMRASQKSVSHKPSLTQNSLVYGMQSKAYLMAVL
mmetsp:Transcript_11947/g.15521  ORF Transcript_11947/g.15521 Transcript_11947/m.15521 type:complete len:91 (+) Transcript_11947:106-378(+)